MRPTSIRISKASGILLFAVMLSILLFPLPTVLAQGTAFTYHGELREGGVPANGMFDLRFTLFGALAGGLAVLKRRAWRMCRS
jgi:hypothetical protein